MKENNNSEYTNRPLEFVGGLGSVTLGVILTAFGVNTRIKASTPFNGVISGLGLVAMNSIGGALIGGGSLVMVDPSNINWKEKAYKGIIAGGLVGGLHTP